MSNPRVELLLAGLVLLTASAANAEDYYVAPNGDDASTGSATSPWATIQHAADTLQPGDTVFVATGTYAEQVTPKNSGTASQPITFTVAPGAEVIIDGASITLPEWTGLFALSQVDHIIVSGFRVQHAGPDDGNAGIHVDRCNDIVIENNRRTIVTNWQDVIPIYFPGIYIYTRKCLVRLLN